jgi:hypothetical protein
MTTLAETPRHLSRAACDPSQVMLRVGETSEVTMPLRLLPDLAIWSVEVRRRAALLHAVAFALFNSPAPADARLRPSTGRIHPRSLLVVSRVSSIH